MCGESGTFYCFLSMVVCLCKDFWVLDWCGDLLPSGSGLGSELLGMPARLLVDKPSIGRPHKHVEVAKNLMQNTHKNKIFIIVRQLSK